MSGAKKTTAGKEKRKMSAAKAAAVMDNLSKAHESYHTRPKCGAQNRTSEGTCQNPALANGRCRLHGGRTPKGRDWHKVQLTNPGNSIEVLHKKEAAVKRRRDRQAKRRAAMTPGQLAAHEAWHAAHRPGAPLERLQRRAAKEAREMLQNRPSAPEVAPETAEELEALQRAIARLEEQARALRPDDDPYSIFD